MNPVSSLLLSPIRAHSALSPEAEEWVSLRESQRSENVQGIADPQEVVQERVVDPQARIAELESRVGTLETCLATTMEALQRLQLKVQALEAKERLSHRLER